MQPDKPNTTKVTLKKWHTHSGKRYEAGEQIDVTEPERAWLETREIIARRSAKITDIRPEKS